MTRAWFAAAKKFSRSASLDETYPAAIAWAWRSSSRAGSRRSSGFTSRRVGLSAGASVFFDSDSEI